jgi:hypothetical protein
MNAETGMKTVKDTTRQKRSLQSIAFNRLGVKRRAVPEQNRWLPR